jgi:hypothetical protein
VADERETWGRVVRAIWVDWALEQEDPKPSWTAGWDDIDDGQREADMRIGSGIAAQAVAGERERILRRAFGCRRCGEVHERIPEPVTPAARLGYVYAAGDDGHRFSPQFGEEWRQVLTDLISGEGGGSGG